MSEELKIKYFTFKYTQVLSNSELNHPWYSESCDCMTEYEFNVLPEGCAIKEDSFIFRELLEVNDECKGNQTLNKVFYAKSYQRLPLEVIGKIAGNGSIDNLFRDNFFREVNYRTNDA